MIACNTYVRSPWVYQVLLLCATWCWPFILAFEIRNCGVSPVPLLPLLHSVTARTSC